MRISAFEAKQFLRTFFVFFVIANCCKKDEVICSKSALKLCRLEGANLSMHNMQFYNYQYFNCKSRKCSLFWIETEFRSGLPFLMSNLITNQNEDVFFIFLFAKIQLEIVLEKPKQETRDCSTTMLRLLLCFFFRQTLGQSDLKFNVLQWPNAAKNCPKSRPNIIKNLNLNALKILHITILN